MNFVIARTSASRLAQVQFDQLEFGKYIADHMLMATYADGRWGTPEIRPFGDLPMSPALLALHYGQSVFEGMKAFRRADGRIVIFRPDRHHQRLNRSLLRMCMPEVDRELFVEGLARLVQLDADWVPAAPGSLYIRPLVFASEAKLGVKIADRYTLVIMNSPVGHYQARPFRLKVEDHYVRTAEGGTGFAKCAGNYGGAFYPGKIAREEGFDQVLWTDHKEHRYIDEVGMMNVFFVINGTLVTPQLTTAILDGITRDSLIALARSKNWPVEERRISVDEIEAAFQKGTLTEAFGAGTAAVVAPIATIRIRGVDYTVPPAGAESKQTQLKEELEQIRLGVKADVFNWNYLVPTGS